LRVTSRAPRRATLPHCFALPGRGCSSSKLVSRGWRGCLDVAALRPGERRGPRSDRSSRPVGLPVFVLVRPVPERVPEPLPVGRRSRRSSPSRSPRGGRFPPVPLVDDGYRDWDSDRLPLRAPEGRPVRDDVLGDRPDDDPPRLPPARPPEPPELEPLDRLGLGPARPPDPLGLDPVDRLGPPPARPPAPAAAGPPGRPERLELPPRAEGLPWRAPLLPAELGRLGRADEARRFGRGDCAGIGRF